MAAWFGRMLLPVPAPGGAMTDTAAPPVATEVDAWLARFEDALAQGDAAAAADLFGDDSYWRDLVAFTWNLKTVEGRDGVKAMLDATLGHTKPSGWGATQPPAGPPRGAQRGGGVGAR